MKAHDFFSDVKLTGPMREQVKRHSYLVSKKVKAVPTMQNYEEGIFEIVGLTFKHFSADLYCILKSDESEVAVMVEVSKIGKTREKFVSDPGYLLELVE